MGPTSSLQEVIPEKNESFELSDYAVTITWRGPKPEKGEPPMKRLTIPLAQVRIVHSDNIEPAKAESRATA